MAVYKCHKYPYCHKVKDFIYIIIYINYNKTQYYIYPKKCGKCGNYSQMPINRAKKCYTVLWQNVANVAIQGKRL